MFVDIVTLNINLLLSRASYESYSVGELYLCESIKGTAFFFRINTRRENIHYY